MIFSLMLEEEALPRVFSRQFYIFVLPTARSLFKAAFSLTKLSQRGLFQVIFLAEWGQNFEQDSSGRRSDCLDPLGNGFKPREDLKPSVLLGGETVLPLLFLAKELRERQKSDPLLWCFPSELIPVQRFFRPEGGNLATEDGSSGFRGFVTELHQSHLQKGYCRGSICLRSGTMMQRVAEMYKNKKFTCSSPGGNDGLRNWCLSGMFRRN